MKYISLKKVMSYLYDKLTGSFMGFLIGMAAASFVSRFFETRTLKNLWGLTAKKTVIDKKTFSNLEWIISIVIGFIVFEIMTKIVKKKMDENFPRFKYVVMRWMVRYELHKKLKRFYLKLNTKRVELFTAVHDGTRTAFDRFSKK